MPLCGDRTSRTPRPGQGQPRQQVSAAPSRLPLPRRTGRAGTTKTPVPAVAATGQTGGGEALLQARLPGSGQQRGGRQHVLDPWPWKAATQLFAVGSAPAQHQAAALALGRKRQLTAAALEPSAAKVRPLQPFWLPAPHRLHRVDAHRRAWERLAAAAGLAWHQQTLVSMTWQAVHLSDVGRQSRRPRTPPRACLLAGPLPLLSVLVG